MLLTISNVMHNTSTTCRVDRSLRVSERTVRRIKRTLCVMGCSCGGDLGERGDAYTPAIVDSDGDELEFSMGLFAGGICTYIEVI